MCKGQAILFCILFGIIKQILHPCVWGGGGGRTGLSASDYTLERQSSLGEVIPGVHPTGMSYLYNIQCVVVVVAVAVLVATVAVAKAVVVAA